MYLLHYSHRLPCVGQPDGQDQTFTHVYFLGRKPGSKRGAVKVEPQPAGVCIEVQLDLVVVFDHVVALQVGALLAAAVEGAVVEAEEPPAGQGRGIALKVWVGARRRDPDEHGVQVARPGLHHDLPGALARLD